MTTVLTLVSLRVVSATSSAASATALATSAALMVGVALLISTLVEVVLATTVTTLVLVRSETHECRKNLFCLPVFFTLSFLFLFFLGHPHFNLDGFCGSKEVLVVKSLDCSLSISYTVIKNIGILRCDCHLTESLYCFTQFKRNDIGVVTKGELLSKLFLRYFTRNELDIDVGVKCLS